MKPQITSPPEQIIPLVFYRRGGAGEGITGTKTEDQTILDGPPDSTITADRSNPNVPKVGGSIGGFIGLISGVFVLLVVLLLAGFYVYNRRRRNFLERTPRPGKNSFLNQAPFPRFKKNVKPGVPALQIDTFETDPYSDTMLPGMENNADSSVRYASRGGGGDRDRERERGSRSQSEDMITPKNEQFAWNPFKDDDTRPGYVRQRSEEWEIPNDPPPLSSNSIRSNSGSGSGSGSRSGSESGYGGYGYGGNSGSQRLRQKSYSDSSDGNSNGREKGKGKGKEKEWIQVELPSQPHSSAIPLRSKSPRPSFGSTVKSEGGNYREVLANKGKKKDMVDNPFADTASLAFEEIGRFTPESGSERSGTPASQRDLGLPILDPEGEGRDSVDTVRD